MSIYPLDAVRNAVIDRDVELVLEEVRAEVAAFPFAENEDMGDVQDILDVFDLARPRLNVLVSMLQDLDGKRGADISTGLGFLPVLLTRFGLETIATERDTAVSRFALDHGIDVRGYAVGRTAPPFEAEALDFLVFAEVLEHLKASPIRVLKELAVLLRPGGRFIVTTPNIARLDHIEALLAGENFLEPFPEDLPAGADPTDFVEHVREYSVRETIEATEAAGLAVERVVMTGWGRDGYALLPSPHVNEITVVLATR